MSTIPGSHTQQRPSTPLGRHPVRQRWASTKIVTLLCRSDLEFIHTQKKGDAYCIVRLPLDGLIVTDKKRWAGGGGGGGDKDDIGDDNDDDNNNDDQCMHLSEKKTLYRQILAAKRLLLNESKMSELLKCLNNIQTFTVLFLFTVTGQTAAE